MPVLSNKHALLGYRFVTDDDISDAADFAGADGIILSSLQSNMPGHAGPLLKEITAMGRPVAVVAHASSGDHERLYRLYGRYGFKTVAGSLMLFTP